jgi:subtilase family serine protease
MGFGFVVSTLPSPAVAQSFEYPPVYSRITQPIDENRLVEVKGHVHPLARAEFDRGLVEASMPVEHLIVLLQRTPEQQQAADLVLDELHNRRSPMYHQWQTAEEYGGHFGPTDEDLSKLTNWFRSKGFTIEDVPPGRTHIVITGTAGMVREALHTAIHTLSIAGREEKAVLSDPLVPAALAPVIAGFNRLYSWHGHPLHHLVDRGTTNTGLVGADHRSQPAPEFTYAYNGTTYYDVAPNDWYTIYNISPLFSAGINGAGQTIAVLEQTEVVNQSDVTTFRSQFGLPAYPSVPNSTSGGVNWLYGPGNGCSAPAQPTSLDEEMEALLDTEWAGVGAPNAMVDFVACASTGSDIGSSGIDQAASYVANYLYSSVVAASLSYGECELDAGAQGTAYFSTIWHQMAFAGITAVVASGDAGSMLCDQPTQQSPETFATHDLSSNAFANSRNNISAGGTDFSDIYQANGGAVGKYWYPQNSTSFGSAISYVPEITWSGHCASPVYASFLENTANSLYGTLYTPEAICNNGNAQAAGLLQVVGGGGGVSSYVGLPTWQSVYGVGLQANGSSVKWRNQPDISLFASNGIWRHYLPFCQSDAGYACTYNQASDASNLRTGGTSFVAPQIAGLMALINQYTQARQGVANYTLYSLAANEYGVPGKPNTTNLANCSGSMLGNRVGNNCIFRDIAATPNPKGGTVVSDTVQPCLYSAYTSQSPSDCYETVASDVYGLSSTSASTWSDAYPVSKGYDLATGLGSLNVYNLVAEWDTEISFPSTTKLSANPTTVGAGGTTTLTATVTTTGRGGVAPAAGTVTFYIGGPNGTPIGPVALSQTCSGSPPDVLCSPVAATLNLRATQLNAGSNPIVAEFSGDAANDTPSASSPVTVVAPPSSAAVVTLNTTSVASSSASLNGRVNPEGSPGYAFFLWGLTSTLSWGVNNNTNLQPVGCELHIAELHGDAKRLDERDDLLLPDGLL